MRSLVVALFAVLLAAVGGCSAQGNSPSSSSAATGSPTGSSAAGSSAASAAGSSAAGSSARPALCDSVDALRASVQRLGDVDVSQTGVAGIQDALQAVQANLQQVVTDARTGYAQAADRLRVDGEQLRTAVDAARANPDSASLSAVRSATRTLTQDVQQLAADVTPSC